MPDTKTLATALAAVAVTGTIAAVVGSAVFATKHAGLWAGITVGGLSVTVVAATTLYAVGVAGENNRENTDARYR